MINYRSFKLAGIRQTIIDKSKQYPVYCLLLWSIAIFGVAVRLVSYIANRSLWLDEAALAISLVTRSFAGLLEPLEYYQVAPVGFLFTERFFVELLGKNEFALRMFPLIAGIASIFLFWKLSKKVLHKAVVPIAMLFFVSSRYLIYYSSEVKQYSTDLFFALALLLFAVNAVSEKRSRLFLFLYAVTGSLAIWFSHPAVFVLGGSGMAIASYAIKRKTFKQLLRFSPVFFFWLVSFALNYFLILKNYQSSDGLHDFWDNKQAFMPLIPSQSSDLLWLWKTLKRALQHPVGLTFLIPSALIFLAGTVMLYKRKKNYFYISAFVVFLALVASGLKAFPFSQRTILYTTPVFVIGIAEGIDLLRMRLWPSNKLILISIVFVLLFNPVLTAGRYLVKPITYEEIKPALQIIEAQSHSSDVLYIPIITQKAFRFYHDKYNLNPDMEIVMDKEKFTGDFYKTAFDHFKGHDRVWLLFTHCAVQEWQQYKNIALSHLDLLGEQILSYEKNGAWLYLYDLK